MARLTWTPTTATCRWKTTSSAGTGRAPACRGAAVRCSTTSCGAGTLCIPWLCTSTRRAARRPSTRPHRCRCRTRCGDSRAAHAATRPHRCSARWRTARSTRARCCAHNCSASLSRRCTKACRCALRRAVGAGDAAVSDAAPRRLSRAGYRGAGGSALACRRRHRQRHRPAQQRHRAWLHRAADRGAANATPSRRNRAPMPAR